MPAPPAPRSRRQPTWRRLVGGTVALFLVILALLVGRMSAGADPGLTDNKSHTTKQKQTTAQPRASSSTSSTPSTGAASSSSTPATDPTPPTTQAS
jgi:cytoskeletal protein RodZ